MNNKTNFQRIKELIQAFFKSLPMSLTSKNSKKYFGAVKFQDWFTPTIPPEKSEDLLITWIGHSSFLIQVGGFNILVDPIFDDLMFLYKRNFKPGILLNDLPKIDFILISHNHGDHFHKKTILKLRNHNAKILIPKGMKFWFDYNNFTEVYEKDYWQESIFELDNKKIKIDFLPAIHWSGQHLFDINKSIWGSWMISCKDKNIYFAGDSAYGNHYKEISKKYHSIDAALMPISPCAPREFVKESHLDAHEAVKAFIDLGAKNFIPMHWGTFRINLDQFDYPIQLLNKSWNSFSENLNDKKLHVLKFGQRVKF
ncbi:MBL fold metallo-hydrolase [Candidatus Dependentiae bacterium]|nr:MBL fold metallo-hydrolase [Candidatus Dependentiae bacterium]